jgi:hypothetical protein
MNALFFFFLSFFLVFLFVLNSATPSVPATTSGRVVQQTPRHRLETVAGMSIRSRRCWGPCPRLIWPPCQPGVTRATTWAVIDGARLLAWTADAAYSLPLPAGDLVLPSADCVSAVAGGGLVGRHVQPACVVFSPGVAAQQTRAPRCSCPSMVAADEPVALAACEPLGCLLATRAGFLCLLSFRNPTGRHFLSFRRIVQVFFSFHHHHLRNHACSIHRHFYINRSGRD